MPFEQSVVTCPKCQHQFPMTKALTRELVAPLLPGPPQEVAKEVRAGFDDDLETMRRQNKEQAELVDEQVEQLSQLREGEAKLRRERRELQEQKDDLERKTEQLRDEIIKQEQEKADQRARHHIEELRAAGGGVPRAVPRQGRPPPRRGAGAPAEAGAHEPGSDGPPAQDPDGDPHTV